MNTFTTTTVISGFTTIATCVALIGVYPASAQNVVVNGDFSEGADGWEVYFDGEASEVDIIDDEECPSDGSPGGCVLVTSNTTGYTNTLIFQPVTLIAGTPYEIDIQFRMLSEELEQFWGNLYLHDVAPQDGTDWTPPVLFAVNWWDGCGLEVDGSLRENACSGDPDTIVTAAGTPGEEVTYYVGFKFGTLVAEQSLAISLDDFVVQATATSTEAMAGLPESFAISTVYPNPFNPSTTAVLNVRDAGTYTIRLYDLLGQVVEERALNLSTPGQVEVPFQMDDQASGPYFVWVQHQATGHVATAKAMLVK